jgi:hypothetical protein
MHAPSRADTMLSWWLVPPAVRVCPKLAQFLLTFTFIITWQKHLENCLSKGKKKHLLTDNKLGRKKEKN